MKKTNVSSPRSLCSLLGSNLHRALAALALPVLSLSATPAQAEPMQVSGRQLLDSCGKVFVVRGVEQILGNELPPGNDWLALIEEIAATGANAVRILPGVNTLSVDDVDDVLTLIGSRDMVAFIDPLGGDEDWLARADVKTMLRRHESYIIIDAFGEPQFDDRARFRRESAAALREIRALGYRVPLTVTANQFGRDLPSLLEFGSEVLAADPLHNSFLGWQAYWGSGGFYQAHYGLTFTQAVAAIVRSGLPIQLGLDHITDLPSESADFGALMSAAQANAIGWLWWDWYNPYGTENNLSREGSADALTSTGNSVVNTHPGSIRNTSRLTCTGPAPAVAPPVVVPPVVVPPVVVPPVVAPPAPPSGTAVISINAGGAAASGFVADTGFSGGSLAPKSRAAIDRSRIPAPAPPESVYQTERWGAMTYRVGGLVAGSRHTVQLHFAEFVFSRAGQRLFNVSINRQAVLTEYDIFRRAGARNRAVLESFSATASASGEIVIRFSAGSVDQPKVSAIVVQ